MSQPLYYDKNAGLLCWKNDKGEYIPVKTNLALMPKNLKIENRVLKIFDYDADAWKSVPSVAVSIGQGDFQLATVSDLQLKQDKALQYPEFDSLLTAELDPGIYNILVRDLGEVSPPVDPTDPPIMEMSEEGNLMDATAIPSQVNNSAILLVSAKYPRVLISGKGIFNENDGVWKEQAGFTENYKSELQEQFESLKTTVEQTEVSTVTCDDAGNLTIITSKIGQSDGVTTTLNIKGKDGVTPQLRIKDGYWQISYDGTSWTTLGKATGDNGQDGKDGADGEDGKDGQDGTDGKDGESSIGINIIPILNDVYLDPTKEANSVYPLLTEQTISFSISAMYGTASIPINLVTGTIMDVNTGKWNDSIFSVTITNTDNTYSTGVKTYTLTADMGPHGTHTFNVPVNFILASQGYDLMASPNCIKRDADGNAENITFSVYGTVSGGGFSKNLGKLTEIELAGCNLQIGDSNITGTLTDNNDGTWTYAPSKDDKLLEVKLLKGSDVVDLDFLIEIKDGANSRLETSVLSMLDQNGNEVAGISGVSSYTYTEGGTDKTVTDDVLMWSGGTHQEAVLHKTPEIVLTKTGIGSHIGPLNVTENENLLFNDPATATPYAEFTKATGVFSIGKKEEKDGEITRQQAVIYLDPTQSVSELLREVSDEQYQFNQLSYTTDDGLKKANYSLPSTGLPLLTLDKEAKKWAIPAMYFKITFGNVNDGWEFLYTRITITVTYDSNKTETLFDEWKTIRTQQNDMGGNTAGLDAVFEGLTQRKVITGKQIDRFTISFEKINVDGEGNLFEPTDSVFKGNVWSMILGNPTTYITSAETTNFDTATFYITSDGLCVRQNTHAYAVDLTNPKYLSVRCIGLPDASMLGEIPAGSIYLDSGTLKVK